MINNEPIMMDKLKTIVNAYNSQKKAFYCAARGTSMLPLFRDKDLLSVTQKDEYVIGDVLLFYNLLEKNIIAHRYIKKENNFYVMKGDNTFSIEMIEHRYILGCVNYICRDKMIIPLQEITSNADDIADLSFRTYLEFEKSQLENQVMKSEPYNKLRLILYRSIKNTKTARAIYPIYFNTFKCETKNCINNCCSRNWQIYIDAFTYKKYTDLKITHEINKNYLLPLTDESCTPNKAAIMVLNENGACHFLGNDFLCSIQQKYGEDLQCKICKSFPRVGYKVNNTYIYGSTSACSWVSKTVLFADHPIDYYVDDDLDVGITNNIAMKKINLTDTQHYCLTSPVNISLLQFKNVSLAKRLYIVGMYWHTLNHIKCSSYDTYDNISKKYMDYDYLISLCSSTTVKENNYNKSSKISKYDILYKLSSLYFGIDDTFLNDFKYPKSINKKILENIFHKNVLKAWDKNIYNLISKNENVIENYVVNLLFTQNVTLYDLENDDIADFHLVIIGITILYLLILCFNSFDNNINALSENKFILTTNQFTTKIQQPQLITGIIKLLTKYKHYEQSYNLMCVLFQNEISGIS